VGVRHTLFPRSLAFGALRHPSSSARLPVSRRCTGLHGRCRPSRPRSGAGRRGFYAPSRRRCWVRLLGQVHRTSADARHLDQAGLRLQIGSRSRPLSARSAPGEINRHGRWPCATGLASYPSSCVRFLFCKQVIAMMGAPCNRSLLCTPPWPPSSGGSARATHSVTACPPCAFRLRHRNLSTACSSDTVRDRSPTLAHSSNSGGSPTDCVRTHHPKPWMARRHSACAWSPASAPLV
jgi:hypothetical protein